MAEIIKISLVLSGPDNAYERSRILPSDYFKNFKMNLFDNEIDSMRRELENQIGDLSDYEEHIRIASIDTDTGSVTPSGRG